MDIRKPINLCRSLCRSLCRIAHFSTKLATKVATKVATKAAAKVRNRRFWNRLCDSPTCSQAAKMSHRMNEPRNTRNTRNPEPGRFSFRVFRVFRGYHFGCGFAHTRRAKMKPPRSNPNGVVQQSPGLARRQPWVTAQRCPSTPTGLRPGGRKTARLRPLAAATPLGLMAPLSPLPRVVPSVQPWALLHNRVAVETPRHLCSRRFSLARVPERTADMMRPFSRPFGTYSSRRPNPTLSRWAILKRPFGTGLTTLAAAPSGFGFRISFGFRPSDFEFPAFLRDGTHHTGCGPFGFRPSDFGFQVTGSAGLTHA